MFLYVIEYFNMRCLLDIEKKNIELKGEEDAMSH